MKYYLNMEQKVFPVMRLTRDKKRNTSVEPLGTPFLLIFIMGFSGNHSEKAVITP